MCNFFQYVHPTGHLPQFPGSRTLLPYKLISTTIQYYYLCREITNMTLNINLTFGSSHKKSDARSRWCGSAADSFPIVTVKHSLAKRSIKIHGTSMRLESLQQLFHIHWRGSVVPIGRWWRGELSLLDLVIGENVCSGLLQKQSYLLCCHYLSWRTFSHSPTEIVLASLVFQGLTLVVILSTHPSILNPFTCKFAVTFWPLINHNSHLPCFETQHSPVVYYQFSLPTFVKPPAFITCCWLHSSEKEELVIFIIAWWVTCQATAWIGTQ
jgi:hypothetical protein